MFDFLAVVSPSLVSESRIIWFIVRVCRGGNSPSSLLLFLPAARLFPSLFLSFVVRFLSASTFLCIVFRLPRICFSMSYIGLVWEDCDIIITKACNNGQNLSMFYIICSILLPLSLPSSLTEPNAQKIISIQLFHTNIKALDNKELANNQSCWTVLGVMKL